MFEWRVTVQVTHRSFSDTTMLQCVRILQARINIANRYVYPNTPDNKTHRPYDRILHNTQRLTANNVSFNFQSWLATLWIAVCTYVHANFSTYVELILAGTTAPLHEFDAKHSRKEHKLGLKNFVY